MTLNPVRYITQMQADDLRREFIGMYRPREASGSIGHTYGVDYVLVAENDPRLAEQSARDRRAGA